MYAAQPHKPYRSRGWPLWVLLATIPLALALGGVAGIAIATYTGAGQTPVSQQNRTASTETSASGEDDQTRQIPGTLRSTVPVLPPITADEPITQPDMPNRVYFQGTPQDIREARLALLTDYRTYDGAGGPIQLDYQQMRHGGYGVSVVGIVTVEGYQDWIRAQEADQNALEQWLEDAARRVQPAAVKDRFRVTWAVVDVVRQRPASFTDQEITPLGNGSFLVIRPLATTADYDKVDVLLRPLPNSPEGAVTTGDEPWLIYSPVILFTSQDYYRPPGTLNAHPIQ